MALIDDLEGVLGAEAVAKIKGTKLAERLNEGNNLYKAYYEEDIVTPEARATVVTPPAAVVPPATPPPARSISADLESIGGLLDKKLGTFRESISADIDSRIKARGDELAPAVAAMAVQRSDELNRVYRRHERDFGEEFDTTKFNTFLEEQKKSGRNFASIPDAYDAFTAPQRTEKTVNDRVREELKKRATSEVPGVTPISTKSPLAFMQKRGVATDNNGESAAVRSGNSLAARLAARNGTE